MDGGNSIRVLERRRRGSAIPSVRAATLLFGVLVVTVFSTAPAGATQRASLPTPRVPVPGAITPGSKPALNALDSTDGAGYVAVLPKVTTVNATFSVPSIECGGIQSVVAPGAAMINKGGDQVGAYIDLGCRNGTEEDYIEVYLNKAFKSFPETALDGNAFSLSVTEAKTVATVKVTDLTKKITKEATAPAETMTEVDYLDSVGLNPTTGKPLPTPVFTTNKFTIAEANGKPIGDFTNIRYNLEYNSHIYIVPGALASRGGFVESWQNA